MEITYNNVASSIANNLITFTDIPNILKVTDSTGGTNTVIEFQFESNLHDVTTSDGQWSIQLLSDTVYNTIDASKAVNKNFYVSSSNISTAASLAKALRNCPRISSVFLITNDNNIVRLTSREFGMVDVGFNTNISAQYMLRSFTQGSTNSELQGSLIDVDVYSGNKYVTTLEKSFYNGEVAFDMSPLLTTLAITGKVVPYNYKLSTIKDGEYVYLGEVGENLISVGYMCNQGSKFLQNNVVNIANNLQRGTAKDVLNNTILYVYEPRIEFSFYAPNNVNMMSFYIGYLNSAYEQIYFESSYWLKMGNKTLNDFLIILNEEKLREAFYIDIYSREFGTIRFNVIKPLKMAESCQRVYWRNSYGGISFFDFTAQRSETRDFTIDTYQKSIYGYYDDDKNELEKIYNNDVKYSVTLKSHLIDNDGKYVFNDLIQSTEVWTTINGEKYAIILDSVSVDETDNNNVYQATVKYHYSQKPSLI